MSARPAVQSSPGHRTANTEGCFENEEERSQNGRSQANANASAVAASQDNGQDDVITEPSGEAETAVTEGGVMAKQVIPEGEVEGNDPLTREDVIVDRVTKNIEEMLDKKLATIIKPVTDLSDKFDAAAKRMDSLEQRVSDLEDVSVVNAPRLDCMEKSLKKALERLDNYENQRRRQNIRIIGLEEGTEGRDPAAFFEEWIPAILEMRVKRVRLISHSHGTTDRAQWQRRIKSCYRDSTRLR
ncbi:hypothetical protein WMY93_012984 [Mugilogobius chulae]|uniref:LINE-1 type transposase domain-containing 1 n=1 Tax=Mugilogobius chulae TaxID=88201 RepID=A0AAW0P0D4_9GOBI